MKTIDLYTQYFLGEDETTIIEKDSSGQVVFELRLFSADFDAIVDWIPYNEESNPQSVVVLFNTDSNWGSDFTEIMRIQEFYDQLISINHLVPPSLPGIPDFDSLKEICLSALQNGNKLFIKLSH